jgi:hypothetical protein
VGKRDQRRNVIASATRRQPIFELHLGVASATNHAFANIVGASDGESAEEKAVDVRRFEDFKKAGATKDGDGKDCEVAETYASGGPK